MTEPIHTHKEARRPAQRAVTAHPVGHLRSSAVSLLLVACSPILLARVDATLEVSPSHVGLNDQLTLTITLSGSDLNSVDQPDLANLQGFRLVAGPSVSSRFQWINGRSSSSKSFTYVLLPVQEGTFTVGPFRIVAGDETVNTNSVQVEVVTGSTNPSPPSRSARRRRFPSIPDPFDQRDEEVGVGDEVFVVAKPNRLRAYPGQQITLTYLIYTQLSISGLELKESPSLKGFWVEDIEVPRNPSPRIEQVRGQDYSAFEVKKQALFATSPGQLEIPASTFALGVRVRSNDPFSFFNFGTSQSVYRRTRPVTVTITPFPESGKPADFKNLTGRFSITSSVDKKEVKAGDAIALTISLKGTGNLNTFGEIDLPNLTNFEVFSSKSNVENDRTGDLIESTKSWEYVIVPQRAGTQTIPSLSVSYFDPVNRRYATATSPAIPIQVVNSPGKAGETRPAPGPIQRKLTRQNSDINFIKLSAAVLEDQSRQWDFGPYFYLLILLPVAANAGVFLYQRHLAKLAGNTLLLRRRRAARRAAATLKRASQHLKKSELTEFHSALATALTNFMADRFGFPLIDLTRDQIQQKLVELGLDRQTITQTISLLDRCDFARFTPSRESADDALQKEVKQVIARLDKSAP